MKILALDPGTTETGFVMLGENGAVLESGVAPNQEIRNRLKWDSTSRPEYLLAIEMIASYGMPVGRTTFETCLWIGRFVEAYGGPDRLIYRREVKSHLCGSMKAKDKNVWQALVDLYGGDAVAVGNKKNPGPLYGVKSHARSALAVAITAKNTKPPETVPE